MKIERTSKPVQYKDIEAGEVFEKEGHYYIACSVFENEFESMNCIDLETGRNYFLGDFDYVFRVKGRFVLDSVTN